MTQFVFLSLLLVLFHSVKAHQISTASCDVQCSYKEDFQQANCEERQLKSIPIECSQSTYLSLRDNLITDIEPGIFREFPFLRNLILSNNKIVQVNPNAFNGAYELKYIKLLYNHLHSFNRYALNGTKNLRSIHLKGNYLSIIEEGTFQLALKLELIDLSWNHLTYLSPNAFQGLKNLERLYLGKNKLLDIPENIFKDLSSLVYLDLSNNSLSSLTIDLFVHMDHLMTIDLSGNRLVAIGNVLNLPNIRLDLRWNSLPQLDNMTLEILTNNVEILFLEGNPWDCICGLEPLRQWYQQLSITNDEDVKIDNPICSHPNDLANHMINSLNFSFCEDIVAESMVTSTLNDILDDDQINNTKMADGQMYQDVSGRTENSTKDGKLNVIIIVVAAVAFIIIIVIVSLIILRGTTCSSSEDEEEEDVNERTPLKRERKLTGTDPSKDIIRLEGSHEKCRKKLNLNNSFVTDSYV